MRNLYKIEEHTIEFKDGSSTAVVVTWNDVQTIFKELFEDFVGNFSDLKVRLDEAKREEDEFKKLSPEEKKQRIAEVERMKQEEKKQD